MTLFIVISLLISWWQVFKHGGEIQFFWTLGFTLVVSSLIVSRSATTNYVMMLVCAIWILAALARSGRRGKAAAAGLMVISFAGYWWLHFATVVGNQEQAIMFFPYLLAIGLTLICGRGWLLEDERRFISPI